ncbi:diacylglycerol/lipid kinase family protein [Nocardioides sp. Bht2]|uniref:diacylglycerol/lipid kinase family protein n=1 Tax=Nocardioides sp. Bht2 TaxID=3392297 RepID=UPI0039B435EE
MARLLVITNPSAGGDETALGTALEALRKGAEVEVAETSSPDELDDVLAVRDGRTVVVAGGDGSLHAIVAALHRRGELGDATVGLIPLGTGNDFARGTGVPLEPAEAAQAILDGAPQPTDILLDGDDEVVANHVHLGISADAGRKGADAKSVLGKVGLGKLGYPIGALRASIHPKVTRVRVEVDGREVNPAQRAVLMVSVGIGPDVGGGTTLTPDAKPDDGRADVMISRAISWRARIGYAIRLGRGEHTERDDVVTVRGNRIVVSGEKFWTSADGELGGPYRNQSWTVVPGAYRLLRRPTDRP